MRRIVVSEFVTLDGVMEDPGGAEKTDGGGCSSAAATCSSPAAAAWCTRCSPPIP